MFAIRREGKVVNREIIALPDDVADVAGSPFFHQLIVARVGARLLR